jgi:PTS system mannose-specific IIC component
MTPSPETLAALLALGTVLSLDSVTVGQGMLSRPLVGATLAGAVCGAMWPAAVAGVFLEAIALETLPVGASRYPDWAPAGIVAGAIAATAAPFAAAFVLALVGGLITGWVGGQSMVVLRHANGRRIARAREALDDGVPGTAGRLLTVGIATDALRGGVVVAAGLVLVPVASWLASQWMIDATTTLAFGAASALMVAAAATRQMFHGAARARVLFVAALAVGTVLAWGRWA